MTKRTKAEIAALVAEARKGRENAPVMNPEDAERLHAKWKEDSVSLGEYLIREYRDR